MEEMKMTPRILNGIAIANEIKAEVAAEVKALARHGITPGLAVILVGEVPASQIYVRSKVKTCGELGIFSEMLTPPPSSRWKSAEYCCTRGAPLSGSMK